jgi:hypothetical protein
VVGVARHVTGFLEGRHSTTKPTLNHIHCLAIQLYWIIREEIPCPQFTINRNPLLDICHTMSDSDSSTNNQGLHPGSPSCTQKYRRHPEYYFEDGSAVFLVENVLFKV